jgi:hypothetical protein
VKITTTHRRAAFIVLVAMAAFGSGGLVGSLTAEPEVVTVSKAVPPSCTDAIDAGFDGLTAERRVEQYQEKAAALTADLTLATIAADATLLEDALAPIAKQNEREDEWRAARDDARSAFIAAANECLNKATAAEAARDR